MLVVAAQGHVRGDVHQLTVHPGAPDAFFYGQFEDILVKSLAAGDLGRQDPAGTLGIAGIQLIQDVLGRLGREGPVAAGAVGCAQFGKQQAQKMVDLRQGRHGGATAGVADTLFDGDGGRQAADEVHIGPFQNFHVLAHIGGQAFQVAALTFGKQDVESQGGLARAGHPGQHHQFLVGNFDIDVPEVVLPGAPNADSIRGTPGVIRCADFLHLGGGFSDADIFFRCQGFFKIAARVRSLGADEGLRRPGRDDPAAPVPAFRPEIDHPVGGLDDVQVVFDHQHAMAPVHQSLKGLQQDSDILEMQAGGGFVKDEQTTQAIVPGSSGGQITGELEALGLSARQGVQGLAQPQISQSHLGQGGQGGDNLAPVGKEIQGLVHGHLQDVVHVAVPVADRQDFRGEAPAVALGAGHVDIREELHFDFFEAVPLAGGAAAAVHVEREMSGAEAHLPGIGGVGQQSPDGIHGFGVGQGIGAGRAADGALVHQHHVRNLPGTGKFLVAAGFALGVAEVFLQRAVENVVGQGGLARAGHAGQADQQPQGDIHVDAVEVVFGRPSDLQLMLFVWQSSFGRDRNGALAPQVLAGQRAVDAGGGTEILDFSPFFASQGSEIQQVVAGPNNVGVVLHHHHGVA